MSETLGVHEERVVALLEQHLLHDEFDDTLNFMRVAIPYEYTRGDVLDAVRSRLAMGQKQYGLLNPETETRDMAKEQFEELVDAMVYRAWEMLLAEVQP